VGISALPVIGRLLPGNLSSRSMEITRGYFHEDLLGNLIVTFLLSAVFLAVAVLVLKRQEGE